MAQWFGLADGRDDFTVANDDDAGLLFARQELDSRVLRILRRAFRTGVPPRMVLWGDWGVGKTHTLRHMQWVIDQEPEYKARNVFVELPDINKKSTFQVLHAAIMDAVGIDTVRAWVQQFQAAHPTTSQEDLQNATASADIADALLTLLARGEVARIAWDWLRGAKLGAADARSAGLPPLLDQSQSMAVVLRMLGKFSRDMDESMLIVFVDEADKLRGVEDHDAVNHWLNAMRVLTDPLTKDLGMIFAASFRDRNDFPPPLTDGQITSRIGDTNYIELPSFDDQEVVVFLKALFGSFVDPGKVQAILSSWSAESDGETLTTPPLTDPALERLAEFACRDGGITTPRDVQRLLDEVLNEAMDADRHLISEAFIEDFIANHG